MIRASALAIAFVVGLHGHAAAIQKQQLQWAAGPITGDLGREAQVRVPAACHFVGPDGVRDFMIMTQNPPSGRERGVILCETADTSASPWFVLFSYEASGYVKDDERDRLDADAILESIREGTEAGNRMRRKRGWSTLTLEGWVRAPFYDVATNNLTWSLSLRDSDGERTVNHSVRLLGRGGVMHADLVADPGQMREALPLFSGIVSGFVYKTGQRYSEWRAGDKVAAYGLTALIAGGAGAAALKSGLLGKLWKLIVAGVVALGAGIKALFRRTRTA